MQVEYDIKPDNYGGYGIFSKTYIKNGTIIWNIETSKCIIIPSNAIKTYINSLSQESLNNCLKYSYFDHNGDLIDITLDDGRFFNHSNHSNNILSNINNTNITYAIKDIIPGEELLDNYNMYGKEPIWYINLLKNNNITMKYL